MTVLNVSSTFCLAFVFIVSCMSYIELSFLYCRNLIPFLQIHLIEPTKEDVNQGRSAMQMGDYGTAIDLLSKAIDVIIF